MYRYQSVPSATRNCDPWLDAVAPMGNLIISRYVMQCLIYSYGVRCIELILMCPYMSKRYSLVYA